MNRMTMLAAVVGVAATGFVHGATYTNEVAAGVTQTFSQMEENLGITIKEGDTIVKKGAGILKTDASHKIKCTVTVEEGVFNVDNIKMGNGGTINVKKGACFYLSGSTGQMLESWTYNVEGEGTGKDHYLGAIVVNGNNGNGQLLYGTFNLADDATFYTCKGIINYMFSGNSSTGGPTLNMNSHTLTLRGPDTSAKFRARHKLTIKNSGPIIVDNMVYSRHDSTDSYTPNIPSMTLVNGAIASLNSGYISKVDAFDCVAGTSFGYTNGTDPKEGTAGSIKGTLTKVIGCPNVIKDTVLTIDKSFVVRGSDLKAGNKLTSVNTLTFNSGCTLDVTELGELEFSTDGTTYTVATSEASIVGTPTLIGDAANLFTIANTGTTLTITTKPNAGGVFLPGEENAAANTAALAAFCSGATDGMMAILSKGDYYFTGDFDLSAMTAANVTICSIDNAATIHATLKLGAAENVTVSKVNFEDTTGPAIVADGTQGLKVADCVLTDVAGAWTDGKNYPYALTDVANFELTNPVYAFTGDKHPWDGAAFFDGGSQTAASWARAGEWVVYVNPSGMYDRDVPGWSGLFGITNINGLAESAYSGLKLRKVGGGVFDPQGDIAALGIEGVIVEKGQFVERGDSHLGVAKKEISVKSGGCLTVAGGSMSIDTRTVNIEGTGVKADEPAVRFTSSSIWNKTQSVTWNLTDDATMYDNVGSDSNGNFLWVTFKMNDHTLTLTGKSGGVYRIGRSCAWYGGGQMVVKGVKLMSTTSANTVTKVSTTAFSYKDGKRPKFVFRDSATFAPESCEIQYLVTDIDFATANSQFAPGVSADAKNLPHALAFSFYRFAGAPVVGENLESLTIESNYTVHAAQLKAGKTLTLACPLTFKSGSTVTLDDLSGYPKPVKTLIATASSITGRPKADAALKEAGWGVVKEGNSLYLDARQGTAIIIR